MPWDPGAGILLATASGAHQERRRGPAHPTPGKRWGNGRHTAAGYGPAAAAGARPDPTPAATQPVPA
jgi:hypothetical protein